MLWLLPSIWYNSDMFTICKNPILQLDALLLKKRRGNILRYCTKSMSYLQWIIIKI
jgi:hypothetical protein